VANYLAINEGWLRHALLYPSEAESFTPADYVAGSITRKWPALFDSPPCALSADRAYEARIGQLLTTETPGFSILLLVGGIGCGKTATFRFLESTLQLCRRPAAERCARRPLSVPVDFGPVGDRWGAVHRAPNPDEVWSHLECRLRRHTAEAIGDGGAPLLRFWEWCVDAETLPRVQPLAFRTVLQTVAPAIARGEVSRLESARERMWPRLSYQDQCWYRVTELAYLCREKPHASCNVLWLDNIDHLHPEVQEAVLNFSQRIPATLPCTILIPIRPYSLAHTSFAAGLSAYLDHVPPEPAAILRHRVEHFAARVSDLASALPADEAAALVVTADRMQALLQDFLARLAAETGPRRWQFSSVIRQTAGDSARFTLRNVHNCLCSPALEIGPEAVTPFTDPALLSQAALHEAYFCDGTRHLRSGAFDNLFAVYQTRDPDRHLIKLHILYALYGAGPAHYTTLDELRRGMVTLRGFSPRLFVAALNELALKVRPLIWLRRRYVVTLEDLTLHPDDDTVHLTVIGEGYFPRQLSAAPTIVSMKGENRAKQNQQEPSDRSKMGQSRRSNLVLRCHSGNHERRKVLAQWNGSAQLSCMRQV
jgi:hypothetical protein